MDRDASARDPRPGTAARCLLLRPRRLAASTELGMGPAVARIGPIVVRKASPGMVGAHRLGQADFDPSVGQLVRKGDSDLRRPHD